MRLAFFSVGLVYYSQDPQVRNLVNITLKLGPTMAFFSVGLVYQAMEPIKVELGFQSMLAVSSEGRRGGLALLWKSGVVIDTNTYSPHHIDAQVLPPSGQPWRLTGIYGYLDEQQKPETWRLLRHLYSRSTLPWVCLGDFNEILTRF